MSNNVQNGNSLITDQTTVAHDDQATERLAATDAPTQAMPAAHDGAPTEVVEPVHITETAQPTAAPWPHEPVQPQYAPQPFAAPQTAAPAMAMNRAAGTPAGPTAPHAGMPMSNGQGPAAAQPRFHERLGNKTIGLIVGLSLACGLAAGVAGTAITNAIAGNASSGHSRVGAPYASAEREDYQFMQDDEDHGYGSEGYGYGDYSENAGPRGRMRMMPQDPQSEDSDTQSDADSSDSDKSSDSGKSSTESSDWFMQLFETA